MTEKHFSDNELAPAHPRRCLSIREAARVLGVSERSVYGYLEAGKLSRLHVEGITMLNEEEVRSFVRKAPGRVRTMSPRWRLPPEHNAMYLTTIYARVRPGCQALLEEIVTTFRQTGEHRLAGTSRRYIGFNQEDQSEAIILLFWRAADMPAEEERAQALQVLSEALSQALDWSTALVTEGQVVLHAE